MKQYIVTMSDGTTHEVFSVKAAKELLATDKGAKAYGYKIYSNGDFEPIGEVKRKGSNATLMVGASRQTKPNYN